MKEEYSNVDWVDAFKTELKALDITNKKFKKKEEEKQKENYKLVCELPGPMIKKYGIRFNALGMVIDINDFFINIRDDYSIEEWPHTFRIVNSKLNITLWKSVFSVHVTVF